MANIRPVKAVVLSEGLFCCCLIIVRCCCIVCGGFVSIASWLRGYKTLFMLIATELEISTAGKQ